MNSTVIQILAGIILLLLLLPLVFFVRRVTDLSLEGDTLILKYPLRTTSIDLVRELDSWKVEDAYYFRWGRFYAISMLFKNGKRVAVSSLINRENYNLLYQHLISRFEERRDA